MTTRAIVPISGFLIWLCCALLGHAQIRGTVLDDATGAPVAGATVIAAETPKRFSPSGPAIQRATSQADGTYAFEGLPSGSYRLCVHHPGDYLDPCQWPEGALPSFSTGGPPAEIRLRRGARLCVLAHDPENVVSQVAKPPAAPLMPISARITGAAAVSRPLVAGRAGERQYEYCGLLPPDSNFTLTVSSNAFLIADQNGTPLDEKGWSTEVRLALPPAAVPTGRPIVRLPFGSANPPAKTIVVNLRGVTGGAR